MLPLPVDGQVIESIVIKKANQFEIFKFGEVWLLDNQTLSEEQRALIFLKAYKTSKTQKYFPFEWFHDQKMLNNTQLSTYESFFSNLDNNNLLENY